MKSSYTPYIVAESSSRIKEILAGTETSYEERDSIPPRDALTFSNGFYVNCSAAFIDIRDSSQLPTKYTRPRLAKLYRAFLSECTAVINANPQCAEVSIHGDAVWGVFDTPYKPNIDSVLETLGKLHSLLRLLNHQLEAQNYTSISAGIGAAWGRALMIKAGYKGSAIHDVVWMGDVVNEAAKLAGQAGRLFRHPVYISSNFYDNLKSEYQKLFQRDYSNGGYSASIVDLDMNAWIQQNCK